MSVGAMKDIEMCSEFDVKIDGVYYKGKKIFETPYKGLDFAVITKKCNPPIFVYTYPFGDIYVIVQDGKVRALPEYYLPKYKPYIMKVDYQPIDVDIRSTYSGDVFDAIEKMFKHAPFYGPLVAAKSKKKILTPRGEITYYSRPSNTSTQEIDALRYVLGMNNTHPGKYLKITVKKNGITVKVQKKKSLRRKRIGRTYMWGKTAKNFKIVDGFFETNGVSIYVDWLPPKAIEKIMNGAKVTGNDFVPGAKGNVKVDIHIVPIDTTNLHNFMLNIESGIIPKMPLVDAPPTTQFNVKVETDKKTFFIKYIPDSVLAFVPYLEGVYLIRVPYDNKIDVWNAESIKDVPDEYIVSRVRSLSKPVQPGDRLILDDFLNLV